MKIVVTGAAGFVGSNLSRKLLEQGHQVVGLDCLTDYYSVALKRENLTQIACPNFTHIEQDINTADLNEVLDGTEIIFHQAGQPGVRKSWGTEFEEYVQCNIGATQKLLEASRRVKSLRRFVYASSSSVYGNAETYPTREDMRPEPRSPYGVSKLAAEHLCSLYAANFGVPTVSLRYFTVYGPGQRPDMAFTRFTRAAASRGEITLYGTGDQIRDFTFIDDVVEANIASAFSEILPGSVLNVAGGGSISINQTLDIIGAISKVALNVRRIGTVDGDVFRTGGNIERIMELTGWQPKVSIEDGLRAQYVWAEKQILKELQ